MKLYVTHDQEGNIVSIGMPNPDAGREAGITGETGYFVSEVDVTDDPTDFADEEKAIRRLTKIVEQFRIDVPAKRSTLVRRNPPAK